MRGLVTETGHRPSTVALAREARAPDVLCVVAPQGSFSFVYYHYYHYHQYHHHYHMLYVMVVYCLYVCMFYVLAVETSVSFRRHRYGRVPLYSVLLYYYIIMFVIIVIPLLLL